MVPRVRLPREMLLHVWTPAEETPRVSCEMVQRARRTQSPQVVQLLVVPLLVVPLLVPLPVPLPVLARQKCRHQEGCVLPHRQRARCLAAHEAQSETKRVLPKRRQRLCHCWAATPRVPDSRRGTGMR